MKAGTSPQRLNAGPGRLFAGKARWRCHGQNVHWRYAGRVVQSHGITPLGMPRMSTLHSTNVRRYIRKSMLPDLDPRSGLAWGDCLVRHAKLLDNVRDRAAITDGATAGSPISTVSRATKISIRLGRRVMPLAQTARLRWCRGRSAMSRPEPVKCGLHPEHVRSTPLTRTPSNERADEQFALQDTSVCSSRLQAWTISDGDGGPCTFCRSRC